MYLADLHVHTNISDCSEEVPWILGKAKQKGVTHIAFTDHDTTKSAKEHQKKAQSWGIHAVAAVEMSAYDFKGQKKVHILGYGYTGTVNIEQIGAETLKRRQANCLRQMEILENMGYRIDSEKIQELAGSCIYKQHILDYLVRTGQEEELFGRTYREVFKNGGPCDFDIVYPSAQDVVKAIKADGGTAVLAHPGQQGNYDIIGSLVQNGLDGIEWNHPSHNRKFRDMSEQAAGEYGLFLTGGSDFHGKYENGSAALGTYPAHETSMILF